MTIAAAGQVGTIYLIKDNLLGGYKIGITQNWQRRSRELEIGSKTTQVITATVRGPQQLETRLHRMFKAVRLPQTEYFALRPEQVEHVQQVIQSEAAKLTISKEDREERARLQAKAIREANLNQAAHYRSLGIKPAKVQTEAEQRAGRRRQRRKPYRDAVETLRANPLSCLRWLLLLLPFAGPPSAIAGVMLSFPYCAFSGNKEACSNQAGGVSFLVGPVMIALAEEKRRRNEARRRLGISQ